MSTATKKLIAWANPQQRGGDEVGVGAVNAVVETVGLGGRKGNGDKESGQDGGCASRHLAECLPDCRFHLHLISLNGFLYAVTRDA